MWEIEDGCVDLGNDNGCVNAGDEDELVEDGHRRTIRECGRWKKDLAMVECSFSILSHLGKSQSGSHYWWYRTLCEYDRESFLALHAIPTTVH